MDEKELNQALRKAYGVLEPFSSKYKVDFNRYLFSLTLLSKVPGIKNKTVLDIGTGIGLMPLALHYLNIEAQGIDKYVFPESKNEMFGLKDIATLEKIWSKEGTTISGFDIFDPRLKEKITPVDVVISEATIEHQKDPKKFLEQCWSLLNPGGYLLVSTPNLATLTKRLRFLLGKSPYWPIEQFFEDGEKFTGHWREYTPQELIYMCKKTGFQIVSAHNINALAKFKKFSSWKKNIRAALALLATLIPSAKEMNVVLVRKQ